MLEIQHNAKQKENESDSLAETSSKIKDDGPFFLWVTAGIVICWACLFTWVILWCFGVV